MKTAEQKARCWLMDNVAGYSGKQVDLLTRLLKEQDRDTRHTCAEAVLACDKGMSGSCSTCITSDDAHDACMNVTAV